MTYIDSIRAVNQAAKRYFQMCAAYGEDDGLAIEAFIEFQQAKDDHRAQFKSLTRVDGEWI